MRLDQARCYAAPDVFVGGEEVGHVVRLYGFHNPAWSPSEFLDDLASAAEKDAEGDEWLTEEVD